MKQRSCLKISVFALPLILAAAPAFALLSGNYTVTFFSGPSHTNTGSQCIVFTNTGGIVGFTNSGTWDSTTFGGWGGNFVVDGRDLRWYGTFGSGTGVTNFHNKYGRRGPGAGGFDDWTASAPPITANNDGTTTLVSGCGAPVSHSKDPTKQ